MPWAGGTEVPLCLSWLCQDGRERCIRESRFEQLQLTNVVVGVPCAEMGAGNTERGECRGRCCVSTAVPCHSLPDDALVKYWPLLSQCHQHRCAGALCLVVQHGGGLL